MRLEDLREITDDYILNVEVVLNFLSQVTM